LRESGGHAGLRIVVIDNEPSILSGMRALLEGWGCVCVVATQAQDAMRRLEEAGAPHFIIADYHLDQSNGLAAIAMLRARFGAHIPAFLITADRDRGLRHKAASDDVDLLHKPLKPAALRALLTRKAAALAAAE
jgi:CheY-like chemotaxis protein